MAKDLTVSNIQRQNVLNNRFAIERIEEDLGFGGLKFKEETVFTKSQAAEILEIDERTVDRYITSHGEELRKNGYDLLKGKELSDFKEVMFAHDTNVVSKITQLSLFRFKTLLNLAMLLTESEKAKKIRSRILDIVIEVITKKAGDVKYINQRDEEYLPAAFLEENYRKEFTNAISQYVEGNQWKYKHCTDAVYKSIFQERANEYRKILNLSSKDNVRDTFYADLLKLIASYEAGIPSELKQEYKNKDRKLSLKEAMTLIQEFGEKPLFAPLIKDVRTKIATRDYTLRDAIHDKLEAYIQAIPEEDYERFLGEKSKDLEDRIKESLDVYKRLKDR